MRIKVSLNDVNIIKNYLNLCLFTKQSNETVKRFNPINDLDKTFEDGEIDEELVLEEILEYLDLSVLLNVLEKFLLKCSKGCELTIVGIDAYLVAKDFTFHKISLEEYNELVYDLNSVKRAVLTLDRLSSFLPKRGFKILKKEYQGYHYLIKAIKC